MQKVLVLHSSAALSLVPKQSKSVEKGSLGQSSLGCPGKGLTREVKAALDSEFSSDGWSTKSPQACNMKSSRVKGSLKFKGSLASFESTSDDTSVWVFRCFLLTLEVPSLQQWKGPFRFSGSFCSFQMHRVPSLVCHSESSLQGNATDSNRGSAESWQGWELSQENAISFCSLLFYSILVCFKSLLEQSGEMSFLIVILEWFLWRRVFRNKNRIPIREHLE